MSTDYHHKMSRATQIKNWDEAERLFDEVISEAGLTDEAMEKLQREQGARIAQKQNNPEGRKV